MEEVQKKQAISLSEVKEILGKVDVEEMDQIQRWTYDYVSKFVSIDAKDAKEMKKKLIKDCELTEDEAVEIVLRSKKASISYVQRNLRIGYNRAARIIEDMEKAGLVTPMQNNGNREVIVKNNDD